MYRRMNNECATPQINIENITNETSKMSDIIDKRGAFNVYSAFILVITSLILLAFVGAFTWGGGLLIEVIRKQSSQIDKQQIVLEGQQRSLERLNEKIDQIATRDRESFFKEIGEVEMYNQTTGEIEKWRFRP